MANLWVQSSAEYKALCYQAFNLAKLRLNAALAESDGVRPLAVIADCDGTVLSSTRYASWAIQANRPYEPKTWTQRLGEDPPRSVRGAAEFLNYSASKGVEVFYVTNRVTDNNESTLKNLNDLGFPFADEGHLLARTEQTRRDRTGRRDQVAATHEVILLLGDSVTDFDEELTCNEPSLRDEPTIDLAASSGDQFIVLPNPTYGPWESPLYGCGHDITDSEKADKRRSSLDAWHPSE